MSNICMATPVRDFSMYAKCISENKALTFCRKVPMDNRHRNETIPVLYNRFIDSGDYGDTDWLVFCHEDFQPLQSFEDTIASLDSDSIYGPIGSCLVHSNSHFVPGGLWTTRVLGEIDESNKDGSGLHVFGEKVALGSAVETLDCQCLIVNASLVQKHHLRFDENLTFDLYAEDFCANAFLAHGIQSRIFPFECRHWSGGTFAPRFFKQRDYLHKKYPRAEFASPTGYTIGAGRTRMRRMQLRTRRFLDNRMPFLVKILFKISGLVAQPS